MGTRGVYGFRTFGQHKLTYAHDSSNPESLGVRIAEFIRATPQAQLSPIAQAIELVEEHTPATDAQVAECERYANTNCGSRRINDWYCLLRETQGDLSAYAQGLRYMIDSLEYARSNRDCEWLYVVDVDADALEVYSCYYAGEPVHDCGGDDPWSLSMVEYLPADLLRALSPEDLRTLMAAVETVSSWPSDDHEGDRAAFAEAHATLGTLKARARAAVPRVDRKLAAGGSGETASSAEEAAILKKMSLYLSTPQAL